MRSIVPRLLKPASSAARAQSVSCRPVVPAIAFGKPIPTSIPAPLLTLHLRFRVAGGTYRGGCVGKQATRERAGCAPGTARRWGGAAGAARDLRDRGRTDLERDRSEAEAERGAGATALSAAGSAGGADRRPI